MVLPSRAGYGLMGIRNKPIAPRLALAERLRRTLDRVDASRAHRSCGRIGRGASAADAAMLCALLQRNQNAPIVGQRCATFSPGSADRTHHVACATRRPSSPVRANLSFRYIQAVAVVCGDLQSDGRVVSTPNYRSIPVGRRTEISHSRQ